MTHTRGKEAGTPGYIWPMTSFDPKAYWEQRLERSTGLEGVGYIGLGQPFNAWMYRVRRRTFKRIVSLHMPSRAGRAVLDVGSGTGEYLRSWSELGTASITGTDITNTAVDRLRAAHPEMTIFQMDISAGDAPVSGDYDAVSCMDVLFHIVDDERFAQALHNLRRALKPGGLLFLSDNFQHEKTRHQEHFVNRSLAEYEAALGRAGLRVVARRPMFHLLNRPTDSNSKLLHRWWGLVSRICARSHVAGGVLAALVYPLELLLVGSRREGVSTEIMVLSPA
ncbi:MAG TPA: methyltransferase domain-containing protein [Flavobacteriales bacterium]|nr:methyltransferase domain-containing protein [Flavobacteriales bacterium]